MKLMMAGQMAYSCNILFLLLALLLVGPSAADNPCETIASNTKVAQEGIRCIGRVGSDLLVVTQKLDVWMIEAKEIDKEGEDKPINSLYFGGDPPVPIEEKWPLIKSTPRVEWAKLKNVTKTCSPVVDANGQYLLIDGDIGYVWGLRWDIRKSEGHQGLYNDHSDKEARWISSSEPAKQYMFTDKGGQIKVVRYSVCSNGTNQTADVFADRLEMGYVDEATGGCYHVDEPPYHPLCLSGTDQVYVGAQSGSCSAGDKPATWTIFTGFVDKGHFYLMTKDSVISFPETAYKQKAPSAYANIPYGSFIKCSASPHPRDVGAGKKKALTIGLIVALALILLICCLCILLCLVRETMVRRKKKKKGKKGSKDKGDTGTGFFGGGTARSGSLFSPLGLSKKFSTGSKRSTGGLTPGGQLTQAGGGSMRTKRSAGPSQASQAISRKGLPRTRRSQGLSSSNKLMAVGGGGPSHAVTGRSGMTSAGGGGGPSHAVTGRSAMISTGGGGGASRAVTGRSAMTSAGGGGGGGGASHAVTGRSAMTSASKNRGHSKHRKGSRAAHGASNKATERSKLKNH